MGSDRSNADDRLLCNSRAHSQKRRVYWGNAVTVESSLRRRSFRKGKAHRAGSTRKGARPAFFLPFCPGFISMVKGLGKMPENMYEETLLGSVNKLTLQLAQNIL